jgi:hypothetical protein
VKPIFILNIVMKPSVKVAFVCSLLSIGISLVFFFTGKSLLGYEVSAFINLFLLLTAIAAGVFLFKKAEGFEQKSFLEDIKIAMQGGIMFTILVSGFIYIYHSKIDKSIIDNKVQTYLEVINSNVPDELTYIELQKDDATWKDKTYMDYIENQEDQTRGFISAGSLALMNALVGLLLTIFFSIFTTVILRKVVLRN